MVYPTNVFCYIVNDKTLESKNFNSFCGFSVNHEFFPTNFYKFCCQDKSRWFFLNTSTTRRQVADNYQILVKKLSLKFTEEANKEIAPYIVLKTNTGPEGHCSQPHWLIVAESAAEHSVAKVVWWFSKELLQRALLYMNPINQFSLSKAFSAYNYTKWNISATSMQGA